MLCFLFAALIVALDQFFKHWIMRTLDIGEIGPEIVPGVMGLTRWENDGAMLNILSGQQWLLAGIAFVAAVILIMILLRYNEGFWGTLGLAAVLGGTIGNLIDRVFNNGKVVDMFRTLFINFPIFNIADIFITLGFITFLIHFISVSFNAEKNTVLKAGPEYDNDDYSEPADDTYDEFPDIDAIVSEQAERETLRPHMQNTQEPDYTEYEFPEPQFSEPQLPQDDYYSAEPEYNISDDYSSLPEIPDSGFSLDDLEAELNSMEDYNVDDILREYGFGEEE